MGGNHSFYNEFSHESLRNFSKHFKHVKDLSDPRFGNIQIFKEKSNGPSEFVMLSSRLLNGEDELNDFHREVKLRSKLDHPNLMKIYGYHKEASENICGFTNKMTVYSEWHEHDLETELQRRAKHEEYLSEPELWYLADSSISAGAYLQERDVNHGDVRPLNIILTGEGYAKLADHGVLNDLKNNYYKGIAGEAKTYLSPELMRAYVKKKPAPSYNVYKADVYSLGMSLLGAANLVNPLQCYDYGRKDAQIRHDVVGELIDRASTRYSPNLVDLLRRTLEDDFALRPDFLDLGRTAVGFPNPQPIQLPNNNIQAQQQLGGSIQGSIQQPMLQTLQQPVQQAVIGGGMITQNPIVSSQPQLQSIVQGQNIIPGGMYQQQQPLVLSQAPQQIYGGQPQFMSQGSQLNLLQGQGQGQFIQQQPLYMPQGQVLQQGMGSPQKQGDQVFSPNKDLDLRVQEAIRNTEETIRRNSKLPQSNQQWVGK